MLITFRRTSSKEMGCNRSVGAESVGRIALATIIGGRLGQIGKISPMTDLLTAEQAEERA